MPLYIPLTLKVTSSDLEFSAVQINSTVVPSIAASETGLTRKATECMHPSN